MVSGIEYATMQTTKCSASIDVRLGGAMRTIMSIYNVPQDIQQEIIKTVLSMDYQSFATNILKNFKTYVDSIDTDILDNKINNIQTIY